MRSAGSATARSPLPSILRPCRGDGLPLKVRHRVGAVAGEWNNLILAVAGSPDLTRPPERQYDRPVLPLGLLTASCPSGGCFLMNVHQIDAAGGYPVASTRHAGVDDVTEGELEHNIPQS